MSDSPSFRTNKLFRGVPSSLLDGFEDAISLVRYGSGEVVFREGDPAECLFLIGDGRVRISKQGRGTRQETLCFLQPEDFFGEMGIYDRAVRSARATAEGAVVLGCIGGESFEQLLKLAPAEIVTNLLAESVVRLRETDSHFIREILEAERLSLVGSMLSTIIHDIRGPLSVIRGAADLLSQTVDEPRREKYTAMQRRAVDRISDMAQEILDYSRGNTQLAVDQVDPGELIRELEEEVLQPLASTSVQIDCSVEHPGTIPMDRSRFFRVLQNIVNNAIEAMPEGGKLKISIEEGPGVAVFRVADTGVGIPPDVLPTIFEPFVTHGKAGGTGLGMAIARSVVEAHGGTIEVASTVGVGTTFRIVIPSG